MSGIDYPFIAMLSVPELLVILIVVVVFFGGKKIPELAKGLGAGLKNFKSAIKDGEETKNETKQP